jgi:2-polyprenyl-3-methyl-5-hydroxy-6-metoxy-1,4-benzoquinol methylase
MAGPQQEAGRHVREARVVHYETERSDVQELIPTRARRILDLGCASGALGGALKARAAGVEVVGVEVDPAYAERARARLDYVVVGDVEEVLSREGRSELGRFDCIVAADVLEHLRDPWSALRSAVELLDPGGSAVVSLPNIRHWSTFVELGLRRRWPREDWGIFDRTHLRWFTLSDARDLLEQAGLELQAIRRSFWFREGSFFARHDGLVDRTPLRDLFAGQYLLLGRLAGPRA